MVEVVVEADISMTQPLQLQHKPMQLLLEQVELVKLLMILV